MKKRIKKAILGVGEGGLSLTSCFSRDKTMGSGYHIHLLCAMIADRITLPAISLHHFWAAGRSEEGDNFA